MITNSRLMDVNGKYSMRLKVVRNLDTRGKLRISITFFYVDKLTISTAGLNMLKMNTKSVGAGLC